MYNVDLAWKTFNVNLDAVEAWMRANAGSHYCGNSADVDLTLHFTQQPDDGTVAIINEFWGNIISTSPEATTYASQATIVAAVIAARTDALSKSWDQLSVAQKKLAMGLSPTRDDLGL